MVHALMEFQRSVVVVLLLYVHINGYGHAEIVN